MAGTKIGGAKAAATNKAKHGQDFYQQIGRKGQEGWKRNGRKPRGFAAMSPERRIEAGKKGGVIGANRRWGKVRNAA